MDSIIAPDCVWGDTGLTGYSPYQGHKGKTVKTPLSQSPVRSGLNFQMEWSTGMTDKSSTGIQLFYQFFGETGGCGGNKDPVIYCSGIAQGRSSPGNPGPREGVLSEVAAPEFHQFRTSLQSQYSSVPDRSSFARRAVVHPDPEPMSRTA